MPVTGQAWACSFVLRSRGRRLCEFLRKVICLDKLPFSRNDISPFSQRGLRSTPGRTRTCNLRFRRPSVLGMYRDRLSSQVVPKNRVLERGQRYSVRCNFHILQLFPPNTRDSVSNSVSRTGSAAPPPTLVTAPLTAVPRSLRKKPFLDDRSNLATLGQRQNRVNRSSVAGVPPRRQLAKQRGGANPSSIEQRTGRVDRLGCKAENRHPIPVYLPYLVGTADERQYRVMTDRESWFRIVMGQEEVARIIPNEEEGLNSQPPRAGLDLVRHESVSSQFSRIMGRIWNLV